MASRLLLAHMAIWAPARASSGWLTGTTSMLSNSLICVAKVSRLALVGLKQRIDLISRTAQAAMSWVPACQPQPRMPTVAARGGVLARQIFYPEAIGGTHTNALHDAVGENRQRLAILR